MEVLAADRWDQDRRTLGRPGQARGDLPDHVDRAHRVDLPGRAGE